MASYFNNTELGCKHCGLTRFHPGFLDKLNELREKFGKPMVLTSACRCKAHNTASKGNPRSLHIGDEPQHQGQQGTLAVDVQATDGIYRGELFTTAWKLGWSIGWNAKAGFLHLDQRVMVGLPQTTFDY